MAILEILGLIVIFFLLFLGLARFAKKWNDSNLDDWGSNDKEKPHPPLPKE